MKLVKKMTALILVVALIAALGITVSAEETVNITINNAIDGATYTGYRLLDATASLKVEGCHGTDAEHNSNCYNVGYKTNATYQSILQSVTGKENEFDIYNYIQALNSAEDIRTFADNVYDKVKDMSGDATATGTAAGTAVLSSVNSGYWLIVEKIDAAVYEGTYSLVVLDTVGVRNITVSTKRDTLTLEKRVQDNGTNYGTFADHQIGESAKFWILTDVPDHTAGFNDYTYVIHDKMEQGLTFNGDAVLHINDIGGTSLVEGTHYTVQTTGLTDGCSFHINVDIKQAIRDNVLKATDRIYTVYTATLNKNAQILVNGTDTQNANGNAAWLEYSKDPYNENLNITTQPSAAYVWTFPVTVKKVDNANVGLTGAKFALSLNGSLTETQLSANLQTGTDLIGLVSVDASTYRVATNDKSEKIVYTFEAGNVKLQGFDDQTDYYLYEIEAPDGYNRLKEPTLFKFVVSYSGTEDQHFSEGYPQIIVGNGTASSVLEANIVNQTGAELPSTGGIGTTIFYVLGGIMVLGAAILLITKKRMSAEV